MVRESGRLTCSQSVENGYRRRNRQTLQPAVSHRFYGEPSRARTCDPLPRTVGSRITATTQREATARSHRTLRSTALRARSQTPSHENVGPRTAQSRHDIHTSSQCHTLVRNPGEASFAVTLECSDQRRAPAATGSTALAADGSDSSSRSLVVKRLCRTVACNHRNHLVRLQT